MSKAYCKGCKAEIDLKEISWVDHDFAPMVLSCQIDGRATKKRAMEYLRNKHDAYDEDDFEPDTPFEYHSYAPRLSHEEPGDDEHNLIGVPKGFWSFDI